MNKKFVFLDIDGTLVNFNSVIPNSAVKALNKAKANGHKLFVCTGRQMSMIYPWLLNNIKFDGIISSSGAYVTAQGKEISHHIIDYDKQCELIDFFHKNNIPFCQQTNSRMAIEDRNFERTFTYFEEHGMSRKRFSEIFIDLVKCPNAKEIDDTEKFMYFDAKRNVMSMSNEIDSYFHTVRFTFNNLDDTCGEITCSKTSKATGIQDVLQYYKMPQSCSVGIGDSDNDAEMIEYCNVGVAMGNATNELKEKADMITDEIDKDGLYNAFQRLGLI